MLNKKILHNQNFLIIILILFSLSINQIYGNKGVFPVESFAYFDTAFRILQGDVPFRDYWAVSGVFIDYIQSIFFKFFGVSFQVYVFHASLINCILTLMTFFFIKNLNIGIIYSFFYSSIFALLAYTTSGTLYVDNHASLMCLAAVYCFIFGVLYKQKKFFFYIPILIGFSFFTKSAPTVYVFLSILISSIVYFLIDKKNYRIILFYISSSIIFFIFIYLFISIEQISLTNLIEQYILFPMTIAENRFKDFSFSFKNLILNFKFIYLFLIPIIIFNIVKITSSKKYLSNNDFLIFISLLGLSLSLMFHQLNTQNQLFILFLIPILCSLLHAYINDLNYKKKSFLILIVVTLCLFLAAKYHLRYNENRKFHELVDVNIDLAIDAKNIDKKLSGLSWISRKYKDNPILEKNLINNSLELIKQSNEKKMVVTNYTFFSAALGENLNSPSRWYISNGGAYPVQNNKYYKNYKDYLINFIKDKNIKSIFIIYPVQSSEIFRYINRKCFNEKKLNEITFKFELKKSCRSENLY